MPKFYIRIKGDNILRRDEVTPSGPPAKNGFLTVRFAGGHVSETALAESLDPLAVTGREFQRGARDRSRRGPRATPLRGRPASPSAAPPNGRGTRSVRWL